MSPALAAQLGASKPERGFGRAPGTLCPGGDAEESQGACSERFFLAQGAQETRAQKLPSGLTWGGAKGHRQLPSRARSGSTVACLPGS